MRLQGALIYRLGLCRSRRIVEGVCGKVEIGFYLLLIRNTMSRTLKL